jgi:hypothetical protein
MVGKGDIRPLAIIIITLSLYTLFGWALVYQKFPESVDTDYWIHASLNCGLALTAFLLTLIGWIKHRKYLVGIALAFAVIPIVLDFAYYY